MRQLVVDGVRHRRRADGVHDALGLRPDPGAGRQLARRAGRRCSRCRCWRATPGADTAARLDLHADLQRSADAIARFSGPAEARRFLASATRRACLPALEGPHIRSQRPSVLRMVRDLGPGGLATLTGLGPFATLWRALGRHFHDPRLRQLFGRYATYCGARRGWRRPR
jgi:hypothetical protein